MYSSPDVQLNNRKTLLEVQSYCACQRMHLNSVPCFISMYHSFVPCLMYSAFHVFRISFLSRLMLIDTLSVSCLSSDCVSNLRQLRPCLKVRIVSQVMSRLQATSRNRLCVTRIEIRDSWRNKMYIEKADILHSVE